MKRKIIVSLLVLFICSATGGVLATLQLKNTTAELNRLISLNTVKSSHRTLIQQIQIIQSALYNMPIATGNEVNTVVRNLGVINEVAGKCSGCHHSPEVSAKIDDICSMIQEYENAISLAIDNSFQTSPGEKLKMNAASIGNRIMIHIEEMSFQFNQQPEVPTREAMSRIEKTRTVLYGTTSLTFLLVIIIAVYITRSITNQIKKLLIATRMISAGDLGYTLPHTEKSEFGELSENFNAMSMALREGYTKLNEEITERRRKEEQLRKSEERFALAASGANDGLWDWDIQNNIIYYSTRWKSMLGFSEADIGNRPEEWLEKVHPDDRGQLETKMKAHISGASSHLESEYRIVNNEGSYRWMLCRGLAVREGQGQAHRMAGSQTDITERKIAEEQLIHDAFHDALTGLPNRALFLDRLGHLIKSSARKNYCLYAVLILDLDRFKIINDSLGHPAGDQLLIQVAERMVTCLRPGDTVARLGGDEFAIILENIKEVKDTIQIAERIQNNLPIPFTINGREIQTTSSIGIALSSEEHTEPQRILQNAEIAMYQAKAKGKGQCELYDEKMHETVIDRMRLESDLRISLERNQFVLHYQPILDLERNRIIGFEALVRWRHPERGMIGPLDFIPLAEETGMIYEIGDWILGEACRQIKQWQKEYPAEPPLRISLNVSGKQFSQPFFAEKIAKIIHEQNLEAGSLTIEITESMIMEHADSSKSILGKLRDLGVHIHVDDFGTGYSSLSYIHRFPVNALKIDRSFVNNMFSSRESLEIIKAILALASNLNLDVIAEGLEFDEQLDQIKGMKCQYGQGFLFSRPMAPEDIFNWIIGQQRLSV